jgi:hypothetical protein
MPSRAAWNARPFITLLAASSEWFTQKRREENGGAKGLRLRLCRFPLLRRVKPTGELARLRRLESFAPPFLLCAFA